MCQAGPRWRPNREIAWHIERLLLHVQSTISKCSPSSNTKRFNQSEKRVHYVINDFRKCNLKKSGRSDDAKTGKKERLSAE